MRVLPFALAALVVNCLIHYFVWASLFKNNRKFSLTFQKWSLRFLMTTAIAAPFSLVLFRVFLQTGLITTILITWSGLIFLMASLLLFLRVSKKILLTIRPVNDNRREFLTQGLRVAAVAFGGASAFQGINEALCVPRVKVVPLSLKRWPKELNGFRIVQVSDLHVGPTIRKPYVEAVAQTIQGIRPDLLLHTGDLVDGTVEMLGDDLAPLLKLKAPFGTYACLGNHEYYSGVFDWVDHLKEQGVKVLVNENELIEVNSQKIAILGVDDWRAGSVIKGRGYDLEKSIAGLPSDVFKLLLAHQPKGFYTAVEKGIDLQLSGHTHGGQIWPFGALVSLAQPFVKGLHQVQDSFIYVSCGTGFWGPALRVGAPSEITLFEIQNFNA